jgi:hypothetical protein
MRMKNKKRLFFRNICEKIKLFFARGAKNRGGRRFFRTWCEF